MKELLLRIFCLDFALHVATAKSVVGRELVEFSFTKQQVYDIWFHVGGMSCQMT